MTEPFRYATPKPFAKPEAKRLPVLELTATEVHPLVSEAMDEAAGKATAEEALAVAVMLWGNLCALEEDAKKARTRKKSGTDQVLISGQIMGVKGALHQHLTRHAHLLKCKKGD